MRRADPARFEFRKHPPYVRKREFHNLIGRGVEHRVVGRQVAGKICDVATARSVDAVEIGMLDDADEGERGIVDIDPVKFREAAAKLEHQTDIGQIAHGSDPR
jgi:hypothetical protein